MGKRKEITVAYLPTVADWRPHDEIVVEQTNMSRKKAKKKQAKVMHVDKRGRRCV